MLIVGPPRDVLLEDVVLGRAADLGPRHTLLLGRRHVHGQQYRRRRVDRHGRAHGTQGQAVEQDLHVGQGADRDTDPPHLALSLGRIGVVAHLGREVERNRETRLALFEEVAEAAVRVGGG